MNTLGFGPLGTPEIILIFVVVLLLFGAKKLPELARGIGKSMGEFKKARDEFQREITEAETDVRVKDAPGKEPKEG
jgi:sec-independent protein translocase protein TatA